MAIRKEWTEWHLTPRGWESGSTRVEGAGNTWRDEPEDRLLSFVYTERQSAHDSAPAVSSEETWRTKDAAGLTQIDALLQQFGTAPRKLRP